VITPATDKREEATELKAPAHTPTGILTEAPTRPLTDEEVGRGLAALAQLRAFREQLRDRRWRRAEPSDEELIRQEREERAQCL
jgi:hypothetical protein